MTDDRFRHERHRADEEKREAARKAQLREISEAADLDDALDDTFPASDPPSMTQPGTHVGAPAREDRTE